MTMIWNVPAEMQKRAYELWRDDPGLAVPIYQKFVQSNVVDHVIGLYSSEVAAAVSPVVDGAGFPMLVARAAPDEIWRRGYRNVLGMWTPASRYPQGLLRLAHEVWSERGRSASPVFETAKP